MTSTDGKGEVRFGARWAKRYVGIWCLVSLFLVSGLVYPRFAEPISVFRNPAECEQISSVILEDMSAAKGDIWMVFGLDQMMHMDDSTMTKKIASALLERARSGVTITIVLHAANLSDESLESPEIETLNAFRDLARLDNVNVYVSERESLANFYCVDSTYIMAMEPIPDEPGKTRSYMHAVKRSRLVDELYEKFVDYRSRGVPIDAS